MAGYKNPPVFSKEKPYDRYVDEIRAWCIVTELDKKKQGVAIALSFPESDPSGVRDKVFNELKLETINADDGVEKLIEYLDKLFKKDELSEVYERYILFDRYERESEMKIDDFILEFERRYNRIKQKDMNLPAGVLAFKLLDASKLPHDKRQLVLTAVDYTKKTELFDQMKSALRKFFGEQSVPINDMSEGAAVKFEPTLMADSNEVLYSRNRYQQRKFGQYNNRQHGNWEDKSKNGQKVNPTGFNGKPTKCKICESILHYARDCPHRRPIEDKITLFVGPKQEDLCLFTSEARNSAVLDSGCTASVAGQSWVDCYLQTLNDDQQANINIQPSNRLFKFGGGESKLSKGKVELPCEIAGKTVQITTDIVDSDIPLLLSKPAMKAAKVKLDLENDQAEFWGTTVDLDCTSSGHYCLPLMKQHVEIDQCLLSVESKKDTYKEKEKVLRKLHKQFAHPSKERLKALMIDANIWDNEYQLIAKELYENCEICLKFQKTPARPVVALPIANQFNEAVAMDLKVWKKGMNNSIYILYLIDMFSRFTTARVINNKNPETIIDNVIQMWVGNGFGAPSKFIADNGGEFANKEYKEMCESLNIEVLHTAAESPWQNGLCERNHAVVDRCVEKILEDDPKLPLSQAISWGINAKNCLQMWNGFSSYQLVFGQNPNLPNVMINKLPALEGTTSSEIVASHLNALHSARRAYIEVESSEKVRRALKHKIRANTTKFSMGDKVFYKRDGNNKWKGPGKVIGQDGKIVFVRQGNVYVRVSTNRLVKAGKEFEQRESIPIQPQTTKMPLIADNDDDENETETNVTQEQQLLQVPDEGFDAPEEVPEEVPDQFPGNRDQEIKVPKKDETIRYKQPGSQWKEATVLGRAGKSTGKYSSWINVRSADETTFIDLENVEWEHTTNTANEQNETQPESEVLYTCVPASEHQTSAVKEAKKKEIENWEHFNVFEKVENTGQKAITTIWVITRSMQANSVKTKARLVARGFEEDKEIPVDSPTVLKSSLKTMLAISGTLNRKCQTTDIKAAFLQGTDIQRDIYVKPPKEANCPNSLWKLNKVVYGLNDAARNWFFSVKNELGRLGCLQSKFDPAVFYLPSLSTVCSLEGMLVVHVDDFIHSGSKKFDEEVVKKFRETFQTSKTEQSIFKYVGLNIENHDDHIQVSQDKFVRNFENIPISPSRLSQKNSKLTSEELALLRSLVGQANWIASQTRPDINYDVLELSMCLSRQPEVRHLIQANKLVRKIKADDFGIKFSKIEQSDGELKLVVYADASHANLPDGASSTAGHLVFIAGGDKASVLSWRSSKIRRVVRSSTAAESLALSDALDDALFLREMISELIGKKLQIQAHIDKVQLLQNYSFELKIHH